MPQILTGHIPTQLQHNLKYLSRDSALANFTNFCQFHSPISLANFTRQFHSQHASFTYISEKDLYKHFETPTHQAKDRWKFFSCSSNETMKNHSLKVPRNTNATNSHLIQTTNPYQNSRENSMNAPKDHSEQKPHKWYIDFKCENASEPQKDS